MESQADGGFVAGLIAGDGHFSIRPNNGGAHWQCGLAVSLRADDTPLLAELRRWSGIGRLYPVPAQRTSRPQTCWTVQRQAECARLVSILDRHLVLGKKAGEFAIWRAAVEAWSGRRLDRHDVVGKLSARLRAYRSATTPVPRGVSITEPRLLAFLAGFATAEAHFGVTPDGHPFFTINLRSDVREILRLFSDRLSLGRLVDVSPRATSRAAVSWRIGRLAELRALTGHLDRHPPRGRVSKIYEAWRELVLLADRRGASRRALASRIREARAYKPGLGDIAAIDALATRRTRHVAVLRAWAAARDEPRTCTRYEAWRRASAPEAPTRNTILAAFGSWSPRSMRPV